MKRPAAVGDAHTFTPQLPHTCPSEQLCAGARPARGAARTRCSRPRSPGANRAAPGPAERSVLGSERHQLSTSDTELHHPLQPARSPPRPRSRAPSEPVRKDPRPGLHFLSWPSQKPRLSSSGGSGAPAPLFQGTCESQPHLLPLARPPGPAEYPLGSVPGLLQALLQCQVRESLLRALACSVLLLRIYPHLRHSMFVWGLTPSSPCYNVSAQRAGTSLYVCIDVPPRSSGAGPGTRREYRLPERGGQKGVRCLLWEHRTRGIT